ncbi:MAG: HAMP domain-containing sensor histidine kinase [Acidimicrobiales bacterium]|nr:HAMP domain-containing sensor histidine kinase [Acidimicrobiales bacterium]
MRRRLLATLLVVVVAGLISAGLGTFLFARGNARQEAEQLALSRAEAIADAALQPTPRTFGESRDFFGNPRQQERLRQVSGSLGVRQLGVLYVEVTGDSAPRVLSSQVKRGEVSREDAEKMWTATFESLSPDQVSTKVLSPLPDGVQIEQIDPLALLINGSVGGSNGDVAFAAAISRFRTEPHMAVAFVAGVEASMQIGPEGRWFLFASAGTILLAILASIWLSRSLSRPLVHVTGAARGIAGGDFAVRLPAPKEEDSDEIADLVRAINEMADNLERSRNLERQFLLSVSHDLRTPLTSITGYAEALADGTADDSAAAGRIIGTEAERLNRLVRDLLDLARLEAHRFELDLVPLDLVESTRHAVEALSPAAGDVDLMADLPGVPVRATADADRWAQVVGNLVDNGLRHADTSLVVSLREEEGRAVLRVVDDGQGIFEADLPHIFERLYVARSTPTDRESGSGLGLAIVRELVDAMNGEVHAESPPGMGATLVVSLPLA